MQVQLNGLAARYNTDETFALLVRQIAFVPVDEVTAVFEALSEADDDDSVTNTGVL